MIETSLLLANDGPSRQNLESLKDKQNAAGFARSVLICEVRTSWEKLVDKSAIFNKR